VLATQSAASKDLKTDHAYEAAVSRGEA